MSSIATKREEFKSHYEGDDLKRVLLIFPKADWKQLEQAIGAEVEELSNTMIKGMGERLGKVYFLKDYEEFMLKYPFMCIKDTSTDINKVIAMSRFPSEIKPNLYLGTMMNVMD